jgi:hypothetical protein
MDPYLVPASKDDVSLFFMSGFNIFGLFILLILQVVYFKETAALFVWIIALGAFGFLDINMQPHSGRIFKKIGSKQPLAKSINDTFYFRR